MGFLFVVFFLSEINVGTNVAFIIGQNLPYFYCCKRNMNIMIEPPQLTRLKEVIINTAEIMAVLGQKHTFKKLYGFDLEDYLAERDAVADKLRELGGAILKKLYKSVEEKIESKTIENGHSVEFLGGILAIDGIFVPPFSKKDTLELTLAGKPGHVLQAATLITTAEIDKGQFKQKLQQIGKQIDNLKFKHDEVNELLSLLNSNILEVRKSMDYNYVQKFLFNHELLMKDLGYRMGYSLDYKGTKLFEGEKTMKFLRDVVSMLHTDVYAQRGIISGFSANGVSIFNRINVVLGSTTQKLIGETFRVLGINFANWSPIEDTKDTITSEEAGIATHASYKFDAITREYDDILNRLRRTAEETPLGRKHLCYLICKHSGKVADFSDPNNSKIQQWEFQSTSKQRLWISGGKFVTIQDQQSSKFATASSINVQISKQPFGGSIGQYFQLVSSSDRNPQEYFIQTAIYERVLDVYLKQKQNQVKIIHWPRHRGINQTWYIHRI